MRLNITPLRETTFSMTCGDSAKMRNILRWMLIGTALLLAGLFIGFAVFANAVGSLEQPATLQKADAIIVLTGGQKRLEPALELLGQGKGAKLLISGVHPTARMEDIRRISNLDPDLYDCCIELDRVAQDTIGNATEGADWAKQNGYDTIILVTSNYHMPRSLIELQRADPDLTILPYAVVNTDISNGRWATHPEAFRVIAIEYAKYLASRLKLMRQASAARATLGLGG